MKYDCFAPEDRSHARRAQAVAKAWEAASLQIEDMNGYPATDEEVAEVMAHAFGASCAEMITGPTQGCAGFLHQMAARAYQHRLASILPHPRRAADTATDAAPAYLISAPDASTVRQLPPMSPNDWRPWAGFSNDFTRNPPAHKAAARALFHQLKRWAARCGRIGALSFAALIIIS